MARIITENDWLSVAEYAEVKGISKQAVYKSLTTTLKNFVKVENGKKVIAAAAISKKEIDEFNNKFNQLDSKVVKQDQPEISQDQISFLQDLLRQRDKEIEKLLNEIEKNNEIMREKDLHIMEMSKTIQEGETKLMELVEQSNILNHTNQLLMAKSKKKNLIQRLFAPKKLDNE